MRLASVRRGDIVYVDKGGRLFLALVMAVNDRGVQLEPLTRGVTYRSADAREILGHWARRGATPDLCGSQLTSHLQVVNGG